MRLKIEILLLILLITTVSALGYMYRKERSERIRTEGNQTTLLEDVKRYKTKDSLNVVSIGELNLTVQELKKYREEDTDLIKELNIKLKRVKAISRAATTTKTKFTTATFDSIRTVYLTGKDTTIRDTFRCIDYINPYLTISGCINRQGEFTGLVESRDTLTQIIHVIPKKFLFIKFGTKAIRQEVFSRNPNTVIDFAETIKLK